MQPAFDSSVLKKVALAVERTVWIRPAEVSPAARLVDDLALGRFGRLRLAIQLEEIFDLELPDDIVEQFVTVADITDYFSRRCFRDTAWPALGVAA